MFDLTLSFDNGPEPEVTPGVLDLLAREDVRCTFFVIGDKIADPARRQLAERARAEGHWIGNHSMHHTVPLGVAADPAAAGEEIDGAQALLGDLAHPDRLFRPFGRGGAIGPHLLSPAALTCLTAGGYTMVLWNAIPRDWAEPDAWVDTALAQCRLQTWTLMVLHDLPTGAMRHLERFIGLAREAGARFRQDFSPECVPIVRGAPVPALGGLVNEAQPPAPSN
ncbi:MAG: polysaccharide deacetylase family protein [Burkholderiales bacterium]